MGIFNAPPPTGSDYPNIPVPNFAEAGQQTAQGATGSSWWDDLINKWNHSRWDAVSWAFAFLGSGFDDVFAIVIKLFTAAQASNSTGYFAFVAALMGDLLGIEFNPDTMYQSFKTHGPIAGMTKVGQDIYTALSAEFAQGRTSGPLPASAGPAEAFLGFLTTFVVRQANVEFFTGLFPPEYDVILGLRAYGELLAKNLGLGRLARRALQPLIDILVATPLKWSLNQQYAPTILSPDEGLTAYFRGLIQQSDVATLYGMHGYSAGDTANLTAIKRPLIPLESYYEVMKQNPAIDSLVVPRLMQEGFTEADATFIWTATKQAKIDSLISRYISEVETAYHHGRITDAQLDAALQDSPLTQDQASWWGIIIRFTVNNQSKKISEAELERAFLGGIVDLGTVQTYWQGMGYQFQEVQILTQLLLQRQSTGVKTAAGHLPHAKLTEAQMEKAYKAGIINLQQLDAGLTKLGYSQDDQNVLRQLIAGIPPAEGSTTLPGQSTP